MTEEIVTIRCVPAIKRVWKALGAGYPNQREQLRALLDAYEAEPTQCRSVTFTQQSSSAKDAIIQFSVSEELKQQWNNHGGGYTDRQDQLYALLEAYANSVKKSRIVRFDF